MPVTEIEINGDKMQVDYKLECDVLIPENKTIIDVYVEDVKPVEMLDKYTWYEIRGAVEEKVKNES